MLLGVADEAARSGPLGRSPVSLRVPLRLRVPLSFSVPLGSFSNPLHVLPSRWPKTVKRDSQQTRSQQQESPAAEADVPVQARNLILDSSVGGFSILE
jgi:hypothetical protein